MAAQSRAPVASVLAMAAVAIIFGAGISACTTGDVFALQPAVDVGTSTASLPMADPAPQSFPEPMAAITTAPEMTPMEPAPQTAMLMPAPDVQRVAPANTILAAYPRLENPSTPPQKAPIAVPSVMPADEVDCRSDLKKLDVQYRDLPSVHDGSCGIDFPVKVSAIGSVQMKPAATVTCAMAASFAAWTKRELVPAARLRYFSGVKTIHQGSSYSCRNIARTDTRSEHSKGNALDVMRIELNNGKDIDVKKPGWFAFRTRGFLNTVRADGCNYFNTVLGPGYNYDHRDHFHFDVKQRRNGYRACR